VSEPLAQGRDILLDRHPLETGDDGHRTLSERLPDPLGTDIDDLGPRVVGVGDDPAWLPVNEVARTPTSASAMQRRTSKCARRS